VSAAALYLHLRGLGMRLAVLDRPDHPDGSGYGLRVMGLKPLRESEQERYGRLIKAHKPALIALLRSGSPDAVAVRQEGHDGSDKRSRKEAA
jgi:hypothetical protein